MDDAQLDMMVPVGSRRATSLPDAPVTLRSVRWAIAVYDPNHPQDILRTMPGRADVPFIKEWLASSHSTDSDPEIARRRS